MPFYEDYIMHHGVKGQKWGVRRYQYTDGSLTPAGKARRVIKTDQTAKSTGRQAFLKKLVESYGKRKLSEASRGSSIGKRYADTFIAKGTELKRI